MPTPADATDPLMSPAPPVRPRTALHALVVLAVCAAVYWPFLGSTGFSSTEGHRVIPGWTMLETGDFWTVRMFELGYLRKPPGMPWAVALSSSVLGQTEFAARAVSAAAMTLMALMTMFFAGRWFGRPWGWAAGVLCALTPLFWSSGRAAEIEALNHAATFAAAALLVEVLLPARRRRLGRALLLEAAAAAAIVATALAKGPASAPVLLAIPAAACIAMRSARPISAAGLWRTAAMAGAALGLIGWRIVRANSDPATVRQGVSDFLWTLERAPEILALPPIAFATAIPTVFMLLFPFGRDAAAEAAGESTGEGSEHALRRLAIARTLAVAWVLAIAAYTVAGVSNPRYTIPAAVLLPPLAAYVARGWMAARAGGRSEGRKNGEFLPARAAIARAVWLWRPWALPAVLLLASVGANAAGDAARARSSGRDAGLALGAALAADAQARGLGSARPEVWADEMIEARPEVLLYAARRAMGGDERADAGVQLRPLWRKAEMDRGELPPAGSYLLIRTNQHEPPATPFTPEPERYADAIADGRLTLVAEGIVHKFEFAAYRVERVGGRSAE